MEHWQINTNTGEQKYSDENLSNCHVVYHKSHVD
jgi:hypothetical protein